MVIRAGFGKQPEKPSIKDQVVELEERIERLRVVFEQYFLGIEKRPPLDRRDDIQRTLRHLQTQRIQQTVLRFQVQTLLGRFNILNNYWTRILRQIENGTYARDLFRARLKQQQAAAAGEGQPGSVESRDPAAAASPDEGGRARAEGPPQTMAELISEDRLKRVYEDFVEARRHCGEPVDGLAYERIREKLLAEAPKIAEKTRSARVDFQVVIRDGRAILKAVPVREP